MTRPTPETLAAIEGMACPRCAARGKTWPGSDPRCAFPSGTFDADNWNCATMNALRDAARETDSLAYNGDEDTCAVVGFPEYGDEGHSGFVVLSWYKQRGNTAGATAIVDYQPTPLTLPMAEAALDAYDRWKEHP